MYRTLADKHIHPFDGWAQRVPAVSDNITERKQAQKRAQVFSQKIAAAQVEERRLVSVALHHDVGSMAVGISAYLDAIEEDLRSKEPGKALKWLARTRTLFDKSVARLKGLAVELRPPALDILGLSPALRQYFSEITKHRGVRIHFRAAERGNRVTANAATILFRVAQEAVTNAIKHGHAKQVDVDLTTSKAEIRLTARDNGKGFDSAKQKAQRTSELGLRLMREMAASAGGAFTVDSRPGKGTTVRVRLPTRVFVG